MAHHPDVVQRSRKNTAGARPFTGVRPALFPLLLLVAIFAACRSSRDVARTEGDSTEYSAPGSVTTGAPRSDSLGYDASGQTPGDTLYTTENGEPLGAALARLDAQMKTAPADSLPALQAEYRRLLEMAQRNRARARQAAKARGDEYTDLNDGGSEGAVIIPSTGTKGLRKSELSGARTRGTAATAKKPAAPRAVAKPAPRVVERPAATRTAVVSAEQQERQAQQNYIDGSAALQAGDYAEAAKKLEGAVKSPKIGAVKSNATQAYALSLEKSGRLSEAAAQYLAIANVGGEVGHNAYISYCRVLAKLGQRERARQLVLRFIKEHPDSTHIVDARLLLQTL